MKPKLIVYNYSEKEISQKESVGYVKALLVELQAYNLDTTFLEVIDGNEQHPCTYRTIGRILQYLGKTHSVLSIPDVYQSFKILDRCLINRDIREVSCFLSARSPSEADRTVDALTSLVVADTEPEFFNTVLITGNKYLLEYPNGTYYGDTIEGGICINANLHKKSIWHETAHILGAEDHYTGHTTCKSVNCSDVAQCLMQWNALYGSCFCDIAIEEMRRTLEKFRSREP